MAWPAYDDHVMLVITWKCNAPNESARWSVDDVGYEGDTAPGISTPWRWPADPVSAHQDRRWRQV